MKTPVLLLTALVILSSCRGLPTADYSYSDTAVFSGYRTFAWIAEDPVGFHRPLDGHVTPMVGQYLKAAAIDAFQEAGLSYRENPAEADVLMAFTIGSRERILVNGYFGSYGYAINGDQTAGTYWTDNSSALGQILDGQVCVDLFDRRTGRPVWHGTVREVLDGRDLAYWQHRIPVIMSVIAQGYPPLSED